MDFSLTTSKVIYLPLWVQTKNNKWNSTKQAARENTQTKLMRISVCTELWSVNCGFLGKRIKKLSSNHKNKNTVSFPGVISQSKKSILFDSSGNTFNIKITRIAEMEKSVRNW